MSDPGERDRLELFEEKTFRLILRLPEMTPEAVENAVEETTGAEFTDVDVSDLSASASRREFEADGIAGGVSTDVDGDTVLTLRGFMYVDSAAEFLDDIDDLLRHAELDEAARRLREFDAEENPLERVL